jgi:hypothetical protein
MASYFREFAAVEFELNPGTQSKWGGREKISAINNALRHLIVGVNYFPKKAIKLRLV